MMRYVMRMIDGVMLGGARVAMGMAVYVDSLSDSTNHMRMRGRSHGGRHEQRRDDQGYDCGQPYEPAVKHVAQSAPVWLTLAEFRGRHPFARANGPSVATGRPHPGCRAIQRSSGGSIVPDWGGAAIGMRKGELWVR